MAPTPKFLIPPVLRNTDGEIRRVGVEIEFGGSGGRETALYLAKTLKGRFSQSDAFAFKVTGTELGDFDIALDTTYAHYSGERQSFLGEVGVTWARLVGTAAQLVVPYEIVTPPIPINRLARVEELLNELRRSGAEGTGASVFYAFGLHLNPEAPSLEAECLTAILKAFALLSPWLWLTIAPDVTRRLLRFADPYNEAYVRRLAEPGYWPAIPQLIDDYLDANPTRNRDLDMLPIFAWLDASRVRKRLPQVKIHPRPALHYRLPDAKLGEAKWSIAREWNRWVRVEQLAADRDRLAALGESYLVHAGRPEEWGEQVGRLLGEDVTGAGLIEHEA